MRAFNSELQLVGALHRIVRRDGRRRWSVELEVDAGVGIADVVVADRNAKTTRALELLSAINPRLAPLLHPEAARRIASIADLAASLGVAPSAALRVASELHSVGGLRMHGTRIVIPAVDVPPFRTIVAIEAKLSDWQRALGQAYRNLQFADESWVVLDHYFHRAAANNLDRFSQAGVGLASISESSELFVHISARTEEPFSRIKRWQAHAALARRVIERRALVAG